MGNTDLFSFIHAADLHLDSPLRGLQRHEGAPVELLRGATRRALENLVVLAISEAVDFVLFAGDIYDGDWRDYSTGLFFRKQMVRLQAARIPVYLIAGNHDAASVISKSLPLPDNVTVFSSSRAESYPLTSLPVVVHGRSFPNRAVPENLVPDYPIAADGQFNIGVLHTSLVNQPGHDSYAPCSIADLAAKSYDYWALGHIHLPQIVSQDPWIVFSGNSQGRHIRELGARGCRLVRVDDSLQVSAAEFHALDVVRWARLEIDLTDCSHMHMVQSHVRNELQVALQEVGGRLLAARIVFIGITELHGHLLLNGAQLEADMRALTQDFGDECLWLESIRVKTTSRQDLAALAQRDGLTQSVLTALESSALATLPLPVELDALLSALPPAIQAHVARHLTEENLPALLADAKALIIASLCTTPVPSEVPSGEAKQSGGGVSR